MTTLEVLNNGILVQKSSTNDVEGIYKYCGRFWLVNEYQAYATMLQKVKEDEE